MMFPPPQHLKDLIEEIGPLDDFLKFGCLWNVSWGHLNIARGMTCTSIPLSKIDGDEFDWDFIKRLPWTIRFHNWTSSKAWLRDKPIKKV